MLTPPFYTSIALEFPISLVKLALAKECNISQRHSAAVLLKSYVDTQWSEKSTKFRGPEPPAEVRCNLEKNDVRKKTN